MLKDGPLDSLRRSPRRANKRALGRPVSSLMGFSGPIRRARRFAPAGFSLPLTARGAPACKASGSMSSDLTSVLVGRRLLLVG